MLYRRILGLRIMVALTLGVQDYPAGRTGQRRARKRTQSFFRRSQSLWPHLRQLGNSQENGNSRRASADLSQHCRRQGARKLANRPLAPPTHSRALQPGNDRSEAPSRHAAPGPPAWSRPRMGNQSWSILTDPGCSKFRLACVLIGGGTRHCSTKSAVSWNAAVTLEEERSGAGTGKCPLCCLRWDRRNSSSATIKLTHYPRGGGGLSAARRRRMGRCLQSRQKSLNRFGARAV
jgi:hypothetical protein